MVLSYLSSSWYLALHGQWLRSLELNNSWFGNRLPATTRRTFFDELCTAPPGGQPCPGQPQLWNLPWASHTALDYCDKSAGSTSQRVARKTVVLMSGFQDKYQDQNKIDNHQEIDAFHGPIALLAFFGFPKLLVCLRTLMNHLLNIVVNSIQNWSLVYDQYSQLFEDCVQVRDGGGNFVDLFISEVCTLFHLLQILQLRFAETHI